MSKNTKYKAGQVFDIEYCVIRTDNSDAKGRNYLVQPTSDLIDEEEDWEAWLSVDQIDGLIAEADPKIKAELLRVKIKTLQASLSALEAKS